MKKDYLFFSIIVSVLFFLSGCSLDSKEDTRYIEGDGPLVSQIINVDTFNAIIHASIGSMNIEVGDTLLIELKAQQNIINEMIYVADDEIFFWGLENNVQITDSDSIIMNITIPVPLEYIKLSGWGDIEIGGPKQEKLDLELFGYGNIFAYDIELDEANVYLSGSGNIQVRVNDSLNGLLSGSGNIYYKGEPAINLPILGMGDVYNDN